MDSRRIGLVLLTTLGLTLIGCGKSDPNSAPSSATSALNADKSRAGSQPATTPAQIHWLGKKRLAADTNAAGFMAIWNLPESAKLEAQTLDKFSTAPWRLLRSDVAVSNAPSALLRPLLDDLVSEESYLEIRGDTNQPGQLVLAIRLNAERAALWQTNLAAVFESLTDAKTTSMPAGWALKFKRNSENSQLTLTRSGDWTLLGLASEQNALLADFVLRIQSDRAPFKRFATNSWLEAEVDLPRISHAFALGWNLPADWPAITLTMVGAGEAVRTRGRLNFARPLPFVIEPWNIPTNLIHDPLVSFTAVQGIQPWLSVLPAWKNLELGSPPNHAYFWALSSGIPFQTYFVAPFQDASKRVDDFADRLVREGNPWLKTNGMGELQRLPKGNGVSWVGVPFMTPYLQSVSTTCGDFILGGFSLGGTTNGIFPRELHQRIVSSTNLVYYDWEISSPRVDQWIDMSQLTRIGLHKSQMPSTTGMSWLLAIKSNLGNCSTVVTKTGPDQLTVSRSSTVGFTAAELHLLVDWFESPQFPIGLHTLLVPRNSRPPMQSPPSGARSNAGP